MRTRLLLGALLAARCFGWHEPHVTMSRAALQSLPEAVRHFVAGEAVNISEVYSFYPDRYRNASPPEKAFMERFCVLPGGRQIHNVTWDKAADVAAIEYLFEGIIGSLVAGEPTAMARYAGTLAHLLEDSLSPAHMMDLRLLQDLVPPPPHARKLYLHAPMELSCPNFTLEGRAPQRAGRTVPEAAGAIVESCYTRIRSGRKDLIELVQAVYRNDLPVMDKVRLAAARSGAELYADAMHSVLLIARERGITAPSKARPAELRSKRPPGLDLEVSAARESPAAARRAALNLAIGLREAVRVLVIDTRVLRTPLGRVRIRAPRMSEGACVEMLGDWPPHAGSQVTRLCLDTAGRIAGLRTFLEGVPAGGQAPAPFSEWIRTVDHRGDPLFELRVEPGLVEVRSHRQAVASLKPSGGAFSGGVMLEQEGKEPLAIQVTEREAPAELRVAVAGRDPETIAVIRR